LALSTLVVAVAQGVIFLFQHQVLVEMVAVARVETLQQVILALLEAPILVAVAVLVAITAHGKRVESVAKVL
jgi:hypothetical protein